MRDSKAQDLYNRLQPIYSFVDTLLAEMEMDRNHVDREILNTIRKLFKEVYSLKVMLIQGDYFSDRTINSEIDDIRNLSKDISLHLQSGKKLSFRWQKQVNQLVHCVRSLNPVVEERRVS